MQVDDTLYGQEAYRCEFKHIAQELEYMAGTDVNVITLDLDGLTEKTRMHGRLGLSESLGSHAGGRVRYRLGDGTAFELSENEFRDGKLVPGAIWVETAESILLVERRHFPFDRRESTGSPA